MRYVIFLIVLIFACSVRKIDLQRFQITGFAQGTSYSITYFAVDSVVSKHAVDSIFNVIDNSMSLYKKGSLINYFNLSKSGIVIDEHLKKVIEKSIETYKQSNGSFDITVKPLVKLWGFGVEKINNIPTHKQVKEILKNVGSDKLQLKDNFLFKKQSEVEIDVNGIAQGYTVDVLADFLKMKNISNYLVELGGEIRVNGNNPFTQLPFAIGIETPDEGLETEGDFKDIILLSKGAVTTSGNYRKFYYNGKKKISHLINAKTGYSLQNEMISVTVVAKDAITADAYDNVLMACSIPQAFSFLKKHPDLQAYFIYTNTDGSVADTATVGFHQLLKNKRHE
ncbi:FAD:protein FMN transferase [Flavobacterium gawalongense]|uniref:FAD:protein FMN transferase n=1 Tax=Flavobacterium gawalongense TaxID=2594432 RepID=UPI001C3F5FCF|nr:FAD:protein FMN transferase [Flavobacterium gawalongense]